MTAPEPHCAGCPIAASEPCIARVHRRYCDLAADPFYRARIVARSAGLPPAPPPRPEIADGPAPAEVDPARQRAAECPDRGCKTGCKHAICNRYSTEVHIDECVLCLDGHPPQRPQRQRTPETRGGTPP